MGQESCKVDMYIGGDLNKKALTELKEILADCASMEAAKSFKRNFSKIVSGKTEFSSHLFCASFESGYFYINVRHSSRLYDLEEFCKRHNLTQIIYSQHLVCDGDGAESSNYMRYEWKPGYEDYDRISTGYDFCQEVSASDLEPLLHAAKECKDFKKLPTLLGTSQCITSEFAERCLAGEDLLDILISKIESKIQKEIKLPPFKII